MGLVKLLVLCCFVGAAIAGPISRDDRCSQSCSSQSKFQYQPGSTYVYQYNGENKVVMGDRKSDSVTVRMDMEAHIEVLDQCEMRLRLKDVRIQGPEGSQDLKAKLERHPLAFSFDDGRIEHICQSQDDDHKVLNIKKGVLSAWQNSMDSLSQDTTTQESDVSGHCETIYEVEKESGNTVVIQKTKDLSSCQNRDMNRVASLASPFLARGQASQLPLQSGEHKCQQKIKDQVIEQVKCEGESGIRPLSASSSGPKVQTKVHLQLQRTVPRVSSDSGHRFAAPSSLLFSTQQRDATEATEEELREDLEELCSQVDKIIDPEAADSYKELVADIDGTPYSTLKKVYQALKKGTPCQDQKVKTLFIDALAMAFDDGAAQLMYELVKDDELSTYQEKLYSIVLAFLPEPSEETIEAAVRSVIEDKDPEDLHIHSVSSILYNFCNNTENCEKNQHIKKFLSHLQQDLKNQCKPRNDDDEDDIIMALKSLGNIGELGDVEDDVQQCMENQDAPLVVRLAAIDAFRRVECEDQPNEKFLEILTDKEEDPEIRINAYLAVYECLQKEHLDKIREVIQDDSSTQVESFVISHLRNLQHCNDPELHDVQQVVSSLQLPKNSSQNIWKYSRNYRMDYHNKKIDSGASLDVDVIYNKSPVLRSINVNPSARIYGNEYETELSLHLEGIDLPLQKMFGSESPIYESQLVQDLASMFGIAFQRSHSRQKRGLDTSKLDELDQRFSQYISEDAKAAVSLKINEIEFFQKTIRSAKDLVDLDDAYELSDILKELAKDHNIDIAHGIALVDQEFTLPTASGVPVHLTINGSLIFGLTTQGKADLRRAPQNWEVKGQVIPSLTGDLTVAVAMESSSRSGVKGEVEFSMATGISGEVQMQDARLATIRIDTPEDDEILLFSLNSTMYMMEGQQERQIKAQSTRKFGGCTSVLSHALGHEICAKASIPKPFLRQDLSDAIFYPLNGDVHIQLSLQKKDQGMRSIEIKGELPQDKRAEKQTYRLTVDTPGARKDRKTSIEIELENPSQKQVQKSISCDIRTPQKKISGSASYQKSDKKVETEAEFQVDDKNRYAIKATCDIHDQGENKQYKPQIEIICANQNVLTAGGEITLKTGQKKQISFDLSANRPKSKPAYLKGEIVADAAKGWSTVRLSTDVQAGAGPMEVRVYGTLDKQQKTCTADWTAEYQKSSKKHSANLNLKLQDISSGDLTKLSGVTSVDLSQFPHYNWRVNFDVQHKPCQHYEHEIEFRHGEDLQDEENRIHHLYIARISDYKPRERANVENEIKLSIPKADIEAEAQVKVQYKLDSTPSLKIEAQGQLSEDQKVELNADCQVQSRKPLKISIDIKGQAGQREVHYQDQLEEKNPNEYHGKTVLKWARNKRAAMDYITKFKRDSDNTHFEIEANIDHPNMKKAMVQKSLVRITRDTLNIKSNTIYDGRPAIAVDAQVDRSGAKVAVDCHHAEGKLEVVSSRNSASAKFELAKKQSNARRILGSASIASEPKRSVHAELSWDADRDQSKRMELRADMQKKQARSSQDDDEYQVGAKIQYKSDLSAESRLTVSSDAIEGPHQLEAKIFFDKQEYTVTAEHKIEDGHLDSEVECQKNGKQLVKVDIDGKYQKERKRMELSGGVTLSSEQYKKVDGCEVYGSYIHADSNLHTISMEGRFKRSADRMYKAQMDTKVQTQGTPKTLSTHIRVSTPIKKWNALEFTADAETDQKTYGRFNMKTSRQPQEKIVVSAEVQKNKKDMSISANLETPFEKVKIGRLQAKYESKPQNYALSGFLELNKEKLDISGTVEYKDQQNFKLGGQFDSTRTPKIEAAIRARRERDSATYSAALRKNSQEIAAISSQMSKNDRECKASLELRRDSRSLLQLEGSSEEKKDGQREVSIKADGHSFEPITAVLKFKKEQKNIQCEIRACRDSSQECVSVEGHYINRGSSYYDVTHQEFQITAKKQPEYQGTIQFLLAKQRNSFENRLIASSKDKKIGYSIQAKDGQDKDELEVKILLPQRTMKVEVELEEERDTQKISIDLYADAVRQPQRKVDLDLQYTIRNQKGNQEYKVEFQAQHPSMTKPMYFKGQFKQQEGTPRPIQMTMELDVCEDPAKKVYTELYLQHNNNDQHNRSAIIHFYTHDKSLVELSADAHWAVNKERHVITSGLLWWMNTAKTERYQSHCFLKINTKENNKSIKFWHNSPDASMHVNTILWHKKDDKLYIELDMHLNEHERQAKLTIPDGQPCAELQILKDGVPQRKHSMCIRTAGRSLMRITADSQVKGRKVTDLTIDFDKRNKEQFTFDLHWDPQSIRKAYEQAEQWSSQLDIEDLDFEMIQEITKRVKDASNILNCNLLRPLNRFASQECEKVSQELRTDFKQFNQALDDLTGDLSAQEIAEHVERLADEFAEWVEEMWNKLPSCPKCAQYWEELVDRVRGICSRGTYCYKVKYAYQRQGLKGVSDVIYSEMPELNDQVIKMVLTTKDKVKGAAQVLRSGSYDYLQKVASALSDCISEAADSIAESELARKLSKALEKVSDRLGDASEEILRQSEKMLNKFLAQQDVKNALEVVDELLNEIKNAFDRIDLSKVTKMATESISFVYDADQNQRVFILDPEKGVLRVQVQSNPVTRQLEQTWQNMYNDLNNQDDCEDDDWHSEHDYDFWDSWTNVKSLVKKGLPPHQAHAMLVGDRHYVTFDDKVYDFEGQCNYLLARDFVNDTFSIIVKYHQRGNGKTIAFVTPRSTIEINTEKEQILVNGSPVETPFEHGDLTVDQEEDEVTIEHEKSGATVVCDFDDNICEFFLPGWFFSKTGGLLGTYDNEPKNDFTMPNGQRTNDIEEFTNSWVVDRNCRSRNQADQREVSQNTKEYQLCYQYFMKETSPLRPAFYTVNPQEYFRMCLRHMAERIPDDDEEDKLCTIASAYESEADFHHVDVDLPHICMKCETHQGEELEFGESKTYEQRRQQKSADVVFVIQEDPCNRPVIKDLTSYIRELERQFNEDGYTSNRYGLAGFNGERQQSEPHSHTIRGEKFFGVQEFSQATEKVTLHHSEQKTPDTFDALYYAARYPFRTGVAKVIVLMACTSCQERNMKMNYNQIQRTLIQEGIQLHVIGERTISVPSKDIYGFDSQSVYRSKDLVQKQMTGQPELRRQVQNPQDMCTTLAQETQGSYFSSQPLNSEPKNWRTVLVRRIVNSAQVPTCQRCECQEYNGNAQTVCRLCQAPKPMQPSYSSHSQYNNYHDDDY